MASGCELIPKGLKDSARGFNPGIPTKKRPALTRRFVLVLVLVVVLESGHAERWSVGVLEYCAQSEKHPPWRIGDAEGAVESVPQIVKTLTKQAASPNYLPPVQGGSFLNVFLGLKMT
jgi:hypothetical protein